MNEIALFITTPLRVSFQFAFEMVIPTLQVHIESLYDYPNTYRPSVLLRIRDCRVTVFSIGKTVININGAVPVFNIDKNSFVIPVPFSLPTIP